MPAGNKGAVTPIAFARLTKVDEAQRLVYGRAVQEVVDRVGEIFDYDTSKPYFEEWSKSQLEASLGKSAGNIRVMHKDVAGGVIIPGGMTFQDDEKAIDIVVKVTDEDAWNKVLTGTFTGFSIGGSYVKKWEDPELKRTRYTAEPIETSLVDRPAVPTATFFDVQKRDGTVVQRPFRQERAAMVKYLAEVALVKADILAAAPDDVLEERYFEAVVVANLNKVRDTAEQLTVYLGDKSLGVKVEKAEPGDQLKVEDKLYKVTAVDAAAKKVTVVEADEADTGFEVEGTPEQVAEFAKLMGRLGLSVADATALVKRVVIVDCATEAEIEAVARTLATTAGVVPDGLDEAKAPLWKGYAAKAEQQIIKVRAREQLIAPRLGAQAAKKFADPANKKYPIDTADQIQAAWKYVNTRTAAKAMDAATLTAVKAAILAEWKEKIGGEPPGVEDTAKAIKADMEKLVPSVMKRLGLAKGATVPEEELDRSELRKSLWTCASFAQLIDSLCSLITSTEYEAMYEGDNSPVAAKIRAGVVVLGEALKEMVAEELAEELGAPAGMALSVSLDGLQKRLGKDASEPHVVVKKKDVQKAHNFVAKMGAACAGIEKAESIEFAKAHLAIAQESVDKVHKMITKMGASCDKELVASGTDTASEAEAEEGKETAKADMRAALKKAMPQLDDAALDAAVAKAIEALPATTVHVDPSPEPLAKALGLVETLTKTVEAQNARIAALEAQPLPPKARLLGVSKSDDVGSGGDPVGGTAPKVVLKADGTVDSEKTAFELMKHQQQHGRPLVNVRG